MPDRNYSSSSSGRQDRTRYGRWDERDEDDNRYGRENDEGGRFYFEDGTTLELADMMLVCWTGQPPAFVSGTHANH